MKDVSHILGAEKLVAVFGYWPSFHDAEVLWLKLDRRAYGEGGLRPTVETLIHAFEMTREVDKEGYYVLRHHVLVHLRFIEVAASQLEGFNHQNAILGLILTDIADRQLERIKWEVRFEPAHGMDATFECNTIEVVSVVPCDKKGVPVRVRSSPL